MSDLILDIGPPEGRGVKSALDSFERGLRGKGRLDPSTVSQVAGQAYYEKNMTKNVLPVKSEPNGERVIWINWSKDNNFKDQGGNPAVPFKFTFKTKQ